MSPRPFSKIFSFLLPLFLLSALSLPAQAAFHLWQITKAFSNADGTVQFIELTAFAGGQQFMAGHTLTSSSGGTTNTFTFPANLPGDTTNKTMLIGTTGFAALGVVAPDYTVPNNFLFMPNGTLNFAESSDVWAYTGLPNSGGLMLNRNGSTSANSAKNFSGTTGSVTTTTPTAFALENPQPGSFQSGIGLISGWSCTGPSIAISVDGGAKIAVPYGSSRLDTAGTCGASNTNSGYGLLVNFNVFGSGTHSAQLFINDVAAGSPVSFTVTVPSGQFLTGANATVTVPNFPSAGRTTTLNWSEAQQNFVIRSVQ
jgi:hypothetical protein